MKRIEILGTGCPKCAKLAEAADAAARSMAIEYEITKVTDIQKILAYGVMMTPALVVDGAVKVVGKVPSVDDLKKLIA
jgi:small redox-active disulfide protein 2